MDGAEEEVDAKEQNKKKRKMKKNDEVSRRLIERQHGIDFVQGDQQQKKQRVNTAVYVTSIPLDADKEEIKTVFSKCGMIAEEIDSGEPRIKMYEDQNGQFKGDALVVYFRPESVNLAVTMLDDSDFRLGEKGPDGTMKVQIADYSYKKNNAAEQQEKGRTNKRDQQKVIHKTQKMNEKLADWDDDDPQTMQEKVSKWDKTVVLKHMFTLEEIEEDPAAVLDIKEDIREECEKLGEVTNVQLFDKEPDGVATVKFKTPEAAEACVRMMNGRWFDKRQLVAYVAPGNEKFKKSDSRKAALDSDDEDEEAKRLEKFGEWLERGGRRA